jgi:hypothetical protein
VSESRPLRSQPPPAWLVRHIANPMMRRVLPTRLGRFLPSVALLRFTGRRTGRALAVPVAMHDVDGTWFVFTDARWAANFRGGAPVTVVHRGHVLNGSGEVIGDPQQSARVLRGALARVRSPRQLSLAVDPGHTPTDAELAAVRTAIRIRLTSQEP